MKGRFQYLNMKEIRVDELTGDMVIYTSYRSKRPHDKLKSTNDFEDMHLEYNEWCPFCRGNETPEDNIKEKIDTPDGWIAKSVANKFPILDDSSDEIYGEHEVIIENFRHNASFFNMEEIEFYEFLKLYKSRYMDLESKDGVEYVGIFKNYKRGSGASLMHPHSQIVSMNIIPPEIEKEIFTAKKYNMEKNSNLYEDIVQNEEKLGDRVIHSGKYFLVYVPYASRYNGEVRIIEKDAKTISEWNDDIMKEAAYILKMLFRNIEKRDGDIPFNMLVHSIPKNIREDCQLRTHIHIVPRKYNFGGFELCTNLFVCGSDPKELAEEYRF